MAGDDGAGLSVIDLLRREGLPGVELHAVRDPSELATLLYGKGRALVIDALLEPEHAGRVELCELGALLQEYPAGSRRAATLRPLSSHGIDTLTALELGRTLAGEADFPEVELLTISIARPTALASELSETALAAVELAARRAVAWAEGGRDA